MKGNTFNTDGIRAEIALWEEKNPAAAEFYAGCRAVLSSLDMLGDRIVTIAETNASKETDLKQNVIDRATFAV